MIYKFNIEDKIIEYTINQKGCWICYNYKPYSKKGYYRIRIKSKKYLLHRKVYEKYIGIIPNGLLIRHKCDNPYCINPSHLEIGTAKDNFCDMIERERNKIAIKGKVSKPTQRVCVFDYNYNIKIYSNAKETGYNNSRVLKVCHEKTHLAFNKFFIFEDELDNFDIIEYFKTAKVKGVRFKEGGYEVSYKSKYIGRATTLEEANKMRLQYELKNYKLEECPHLMFFKAYGLI